MRRKEVIEYFINVFSDFMLENNYRFYKNCFVKYNNGVLNRVGIWTRKNLNEVSFDIVHYCKSIYENFVSIEDENEHDDFSLVSVLYADGILNDIEWTYGYGNKDDMTAKIDSAFSLYKKYFPGFDCKDIDDYNLKTKAYNEKLNAGKETDPYVQVMDVFSGELTSETVEEANRNRLNETLRRARFTSFCIIQQIEQRICHLPLQVRKEFDDILRDIKYFNNDISYISALYNNDEEFLNPIFESEKKDIELVVNKNKELLEKSGISIPD